MKKTTNYTQPTSIIALGAPGTGKTTLVLQFPKPFVLDCDKNQAGPLRWLKEHGKPTDDIYYGSPYEDDAGATLPREKWYARSAELLTEACGSPDIETVIIDSLTSFVDIALVEVLRQQGRKLGSFSLDNKSSKPFDDQMQIQDWGFFFSLLKQFIFRLKATGKTIIFTGHVKVAEDSVSGMMRQSIACPGQMADVIAGFFGEVWLFESSVDTKTKTETRTLRTFPTTKSMESLGLKSSTGIVSGVPVDPAEVLKRLFNK